jgi:hypothetical protein
VELRAPFAPLSEVVIRNLEAFRPVESLVNRHIYPENHEAEKMEPASKRAESLERASHATGNLGKPPRVGPGPPVPP